MVEKKDEKINYARLYAKDFRFVKFIWQTFWVWCIFAPIIFIFYNVKITGRKNIPRHAKIICAANHISYADPILLAIATQRPLAFMAKKELFGVGGFITWWFRSVCAFSVNREKLEISTIKTSLEIFKKKHWALGIFPQGGIKKEEKEKIEHPNKGFAFIAKRVGATIMPMSIEGIREYNWDIFKRPKLEIKIGTPLSPDLSEEEIVRQWAKQVGGMLSKY